MKNTFRKIKNLLYKNPELEKRIPSDEWKRLARDYRNPSRRIPEFVMRRDLERIKGYLNM